MDGLLIFDHSNDLIFRKFNDGMKKKIGELALGHGLVVDNSVSYIETFCYGFFRQSYFSFQNKQKS